MEHRGEYETSQTLVLTGMALLAVGLGSVLWARQLLKHPRLNPEETPGEPRETTRWVARQFRRFATERRLSAENARAS